jgi:hypothetical protein
MTNIKRGLTLFLLFLLAGLCLEKFWVLTQLANGFKLEMTEGNPITLAFYMVLMFVCAGVSIILAVVDIINWGMIKRERDE